MRPKRQRVWLAFLGSVLLHGIALLLFALIVAWRPPAAATPPPEEPMQLEVVQEEPPPTPPPLPDSDATPTPKPKLLVDAAGLDADSSPAPDAPLSERSTRASSSVQDENGPQGTTQAGRKMASFQFDPRPPAPGLVTHADPITPTPRPETAPDPPKPDRSAARPSPTPQPSIVATPPPPTTPAPTAAPDEFAMAMATPPPPPEDPFDPSIRSTTPPLPKPVTRPREARDPTPVGALSSEERSRSAVRGPGGIDTLATPASRYAHEVTDIIKAIWSRSIKRREDSPFGTAVIHCTINKEGLALNPRIVSNTSDVIFGSVSLQAVVVARLPAMPDEVVAELEGKLAIDITFDFTPMPQEAAAH